MYKAILVPLDGSKEAEAILPHMENIAQCKDIGQGQQTQVILLHVVERVFSPESPYNSLLDIETKDEAERREKTNKAGRYLAVQRAKLRQQGFIVKMRIELGPIVETIIDVAEQEDVDLILMTSRGRRGLARMFHGSIASGVRRQADRALLLICPQEMD